jgi:hypothetical protein
VGDYLTESMHESPKEFLRLVVGVAFRAGAEFRTSMLVVFSVPQPFSPAKLGAQLSAKCAVAAQLFPRGCCRELSCRFNQSFVNMCSGNPTSSKVDVSARGDERYPGYHM